MKTNKSLLARLALFKDGKYDPRKPRPSCASTWGGTPFKMGENAGYRDTWGRWHESPESCFRFAGLAHELANIKHTGWHTDDIHCGGDELARGVVYRLPRSRGFLAAIADPWQADKDGHGPCIFEIDSNGNLEIHETEQDAATRADRLAEIYAESERLHNEQERERERLQEQIEAGTASLDAFRRMTRELIREIRDSSGISAGLCDRLKNDIRNWRAAMHNGHQEIKSARRQLEELPAA